jgi:hypothetical protein
LMRAKESGIIDTAVHDALLVSARSLFYPKRTYRAIVSGSGNEVDAATRKRFLAWVDTNTCDQKRNDAIEALRYIADICDR